MFGERLLEIRKDYGFTQEFFAQYVGVSKPHISKLEAGKSNPSKTLIRLICRLFKVNEEWLIHGTGKKYAKDGIIHMADREDAIRSSAAYILKYFYIAEALFPSCNLDDSIVDIFNNNGCLHVLNFLIKRMLSSPEGVEEVANTLKKTFPEFASYDTHSSALLSLPKEWLEISEQRESEFAKLEIWNDAQTLGFGGLEGLRFASLEENMAREEKLLSHRVYTVSESDECFGSDDL